MVNNATDLELKERNDNAQFASELNSKQEPVNQNTANASTLDCSSTPEVEASQIIEEVTFSPVVETSSVLETDSKPQNNSSIENQPEAENNNVNCLALTVKKDYSLSIAKHVFVRTWKTTWRVALSVFILNFLSFFF